MSQTAARLVDHALALPPGRSPGTNSPPDFLSPGALPLVPVRQGVLALPIALRRLLAAQPHTITREALVPPNWDPFKDFKGLNLQIMDNGDPRAMQFHKRMREVWANAPPNPKIVGQDVCIPGFVVPLEDSKEGMEEFLLVTYFGACIHGPPPPANRNIHVLPRSPARGLRSMDTVWISRRISTVRTDSFMGAASYRIQAVDVSPYQDKAR